MFTCKVCGSEVERGQAYCTTCGAEVVSNYEVTCPACGTKNNAGSRFCANCGGALGVLRKPVCDICGTPNLPGAKFCVVCGAPVTDSDSPFTEEDVVEFRKNKMNVDLMVKERMKAVDKEVAEMKKRVADDKTKAMKEIEDYRKKTNEELSKQAKILNAYRDKVNELGSEDVAQLKKLSQAIRNYSSYYADPYSAAENMDELKDPFICPVCGAINAGDAVKCNRCGRSRARSILLLAKGKIKQSPPVRKKVKVLEAPEADLTSRKTPTFDEFAGEAFAEAQTKPIAMPDEQKDAPRFANGAQHFVPGGGYYPYPPMAPYGAPVLYNKETGEPYQMPPIVQPVAFVPYVTQEQPLMQYLPTGEYAAPAPEPAAPAVQNRTTDVDKKKI
ncbi:MAG: double zinc ribbon domain-containing protein [Acutalibacteraceae bacterium]